MILLDVVNQCCYRTGDPTVRSVFGNEDNAREWLGYISQACSEIKEEHKWAKLKKDIEFITSGDKKSYPLPADFSEMATYNIYNLTNMRYIPCASDDSELTKIASRNVSQSTIRFRIMGDNIQFTYPIENGIKLAYTYVSDYPVKHVDGENVEYKRMFNDDNDEFILDDELLILKAIALRSVNLGFPDAPKREDDYSRRLQLCMDKDGGNMKYSLVWDGYFNKTTPVEWSQY